MAATLLAVIVALAIGHLAPDAASGVRQYGWFGGWLRWLNAQFPEGSIWRGRYGIALALVVPLLVVGLFQFALDQPLWGFVGLLFDIAVLFYCWGPRDLDLDVAAVLDAPDAASRRSAAERLWPEGEPAKLDGASLVEAVFRNALRRWFGVVGSRGPDPRDRHDGWCDRCALVASRAIASCSKTGKAADDYRRPFFCHVACAPCFQLSRLMFVAGPVSTLYAGPAGSDPSTVAAFQTASRVNTPDA